MHESTDNWAGDRREHKTGGGKREREVVSVMYRFSEESVLPGTNAESLQHKGDIGEKSDQNP